MNSFARAWRFLPWDGQGFSDPADSELAELRRRAAQEFWLRVPAWSRPLLKTISLSGWALKAFVQTRRFGWSGELFLDCLKSGGAAREVWIWGHCFPGSSLHPLPGVSTARLLTRLGDPAQRRLLADKRKTCELLASAGLPVPHAFDAKSADTWNTPKSLFVKPRFGSAGRGAMVVDVLGEGWYRIDNRNLIAQNDLQLALLAMGPDPVVETNLAAAEELAALAGEGPAPVLRLTTAREPRGRPFLHSALISVDVPGERNRNFIRGRMWVAVDSWGRMKNGIWFAKPGERYAALPWNSLMIEERPVPDFGRAVEVVLTAMALLPDLPLVNWDLIVTPEGPVVLEGNTCGDWILTNLGVAAGLENVPLVPILQRWADYIDIDANKVR